MAHDTGAPSWLPTPTVEGKLDAILLGGDKAERLAIASPFYVLDAVAMRGGFHCLTNEGIASFGL